MDLGPTFFPIGLLSDLVTMYSITATGGTSTGQSLVLYGRGSGAFVDITMPVGTSCTVAFKVGTTDNDTFGNSDAQPVQALNVATGVVASSFALTGHAQFMVNCPGAGQLWAQVTVYAGGGTVTAKGRPLMGNVEWWTLKQLQQLTALISTHNTVSSATGLLPVGGFGTGLIPTPVSEGNQVRQWYDRQGVLQTTVRGYGLATTVTGASIPDSNEYFGGDASTGGINVRDMAGGKIGASTPAGAYGASGRYFVPLAISGAMFARLRALFVITQAFDYNVTLEIYEATAFNATLIKPLSTLTIPAGLTGAFSISGSSPNTLGVTGIENVAANAHYRVLECDEAQGILFWWRRSNSAMATGLIDAYFRRFQ